MGSFRKRRRKSAPLCYKLYEMVQPFVEERKTAKVATKTIDNFVGPVRFYKNKYKYQVPAPWAGSRYEAEYTKQDKKSEYGGVFKNAKRDCRRRNRTQISAAHEYMNAPTYSQLYEARLAATKPTSFRPGPIAAETSTKIPRSEVADVYRKYGKHEFGGLPVPGYSPIHPTYRYYLTRDYKRTIPLRPDRAGKFGSKLDLTTTHDKAFTSERFPAQRRFRSEPVGGPYQQGSDFRMKTKPVLPPVGPTSGYAQSFVSPDLKKITPVRNFKPVLEKPVQKYNIISHKGQISQLNLKMESQSTAQAAYTGKSATPAAFCNRRMQTLKIQ